MSAGRSGSNRTRRVLAWLAAVAAVSVGAAAAALAVGRGGPGPHAAGPHHSAAASPHAAPPQAVRALVLGDSTAAGAGLAPLAHPSPQDTACGRSAASYAADLAALPRWHVLSLACDGATIAAGVLGPQRRGTTLLPPQFGAAAAARHVSVIIVSIGANDAGWMSDIEGCFMHARCGGAASELAFHRQLASFREAFRSLLGRLATLPGRPRVVINRYYDPFGPLGCLRQVGLDTADVDTLTAQLAALNGVLARGAARFGFLSPQPDFAGHALCTPRPYVQWLLDPAPFHPTAQGELAIAHTDQTALAAQR